MIEASHAQRIRAAVLAELGVDALVIVKSANDVEAALEGNPLAAIATDPTRLLVAFVSDQKALAALPVMADAARGHSAFTSNATRPTCGARTEFLKAKWRSICSKIWRNRARSATTQPLQKFMR